MSRGGVYVLRDERLQELAKQFHDGFVDAGDAGDAMGMAIVPVEPIELMSALDELITARAVIVAVKERLRLENRLNDHYETCADCQARRQWEHENEDWLTSEYPPEQPKTEEVGACPVVINLLVDQMRATEEFKTALHQFEGGE